MSLKYRLSELKEDQNNALKKQIKPIENKEAVKKGSRGRPATGKSPCIQIQVPEKLLKEFKDYCENNGISFASGCRMAMKRLLEQERKRIQDMRNF